MPLKSLDGNQLTLKCLISQLLKTKNKKNRSNASSTHAVSGEQDREKTYSNSGQYALLLQGFRNKCFKIHHLPHVVVHSCSLRHAFSQALRIDNKTHVKAPS